MFYRLTDRRTYILSIWYFNLVAGGKENAGAVLQIKSLYLVY